STAVQQQVDGSLSANRGELSDPDGNDRAVRAAVLADLVQTGETHVRAVVGVFRGFDAVGAEPGGGYREVATHPHDSRGEALPSVNDCPDALVCLAYVVGINVRPCVSAAVADDERQDGCARHP